MQDSLSQTPTSPTKAEAGYHGIVPAFYTCYDEKGALSIERCQLLAHHLQAQGVHGLYVGGSSGECIYLSVPERKRLLEAVVEAVGEELFIIAHVACNNTADTVELAAHANSLGVRAIAAIPPIYFRLSDAAIAAYWQAASEAAPDCDFFIYNIPQLAGVELSQQLYRTMLKNPRVAGVKNSSMAGMDIERFKAIAPEKTIWNGPDEQLAGGLAMGASGGIGGTYAVMPKLYLAIYEAMQKGEIAVAQQLQRKATDIIQQLLMGPGHLYAVAKAVLSQQIGQDLGGVRPPLPGLVGTEPIAEICAAIAAVQGSL